jgi:hypothetical protein
MDSKVTQILKDAAVKFGIPFEILYAIVMTESGGNPNSHAVTSKEDSRGLFQVNIKAHPDANSGQLFNPEYNANYWVPQLVPSYKAGKAKGLAGADLAAYVERYGERPAWTDAVNNSVRKHYNNIAGGGNSLLQDKAGYNSNTGTVKDVTGNEVQVGGTGFTAIEGMFKTFMDNAKFSLTYAMLFILLLFSLYMVFVKGGK